MSRTRRAVTHWVRQEDRERRNVLAGYSQAHWILEVPAGRAWRYDRKNLLSTRGVDGSCSNFFDPTEKKGNHKRIRQHSQRLIRDQVEEHYDNLWLEHLEALWFEDHGPLNQMSLNWPDLGNDDDDWGTEEPDERDFWGGWPYWDDEEPPSSTQQLDDIDYSEEGFFEYVD